MRKWLEKGYAGLVVGEPQRLAKGRGGSGAVRGPLAYLRKHMRAGRLDYGAMRRGGLPVGRGGIESTIRRVINLSGSVQK